MHLENSNIFIIGAGGLGREIAATLLHPAISAVYSLQGFIDDNAASGSLVNGITVQGNKLWLIEQSQAAVIFGIGNPGIRKTLVDLLSAYGFHYPVIIHPGAHIHQEAFVAIGDGSYIADGVILTTNIRIGRHCILLPGVSLSHDTVIGDFCTLMPGVRISSGATIGNGVFIGAGSIIASPTDIPDGSVIPAGTIFC